ncbi:MAG: pyrroline-5-carboxylate reductase [Nitrospirae bacterium]|nr:pyrroline-5-carboxylate reductase [Nitrospirota bacterium]
MILLKSLVSLPFVATGSLSVYDPDPEVKRKTDKMKIRYSNTAKDSVKGKSWVILAVKPQILPALLTEIRDALLPGSVIISIAAGVTIVKMQSLLNAGQKIVRAMPNTPALIKKGMTALSYSKEISAQEKALIRRIFNRIGKTCVVNEDQMNAVTALSGSGPAYLFAFVEALVAGGVELGLSEKSAMQMATQTIFGSVKLLIKTGLSPREQIQKVASPGGTTVAALAMLEKREFKDTVISAMKAASHRSFELGKG